MADQGVLPAARDPGRQDHADAQGDDLQALRSILIGPAERQLQQIQGRLDDRFSNARDVAMVLPQALETRARDPELAHALMTPVERALTDSVRRHPQPLADAIFPIIGPAIRRAVAASLAAMVESFNRAVEHSISRRALRWRFEAFRTGKSFGEVVLLHTLVYRVEQVFLIHSRTGLLLQHARAGPEHVEDAQLVSAMLTAIRDFVHDSFRLREAESLDTLQIGELCVWVEPGPLAIVAMVTRGNPPHELRNVLQHALETVHLQHGEALMAFDGDPQPFESTRPALEECLHAEYCAGQAGRTRPFWIFAAILALALGAWLAFASREGVRWTRFVTALKNEPGIVVISSSRSGGTYVVVGLRDPLARDPESILRQSQIAPDAVVSRWEPYQALTPPFVLARARQALQPPAGTTLALENGVLTAGGVAPAAWIAETRRVAPLVAGISAFNSAALVESSLRTRIGRVEAAIFLFPRGSSTLLPGQDEELKAVAGEIREIDALAADAAPAPRMFRLEVVGHSDSDGATASNLPLSRARAERVLMALDLPTLTNLDSRLTGAGSDQPLQRGTAEADKQRNRRVSFRFVQTSAHAAGSGR